jgi:hypothetical protein
MSKKSRKWKAWALDLLSRHGRALPENTKGRGLRASVLTFIQWHYSLQGEIADLKRALASSQATEKSFRDNWEHCRGELDRIANESQSRPTEPPSVAVQTEPLLECLQDWFGWASVLVPPTDLVEPTFPRHERAEGWPSQAEWYRAKISARIDAVGSTEAERDRLLAELQTWKSWAYEQEDRAGLVDAVDDESVRKNLAEQLRILRQDVIDRDRWIGEWDKWAALTSESLGHSHPTLTPARVRELLGEEMLRARGEADRFRSDADLFRESRDAFCKERNSAEEVRNRAIEERNEASRAWRDWARSYSGHFGVAVREALNTSPTDKVIREAISGLISELSFQRTDLGARTENNEWREWAARVMKDRGWELPGSAPVCWEFQQRVESCLIEYAAVEDGKNARRASPSQSLQSPPEPVCLDPAIQSSTQNASGHAPSCSCSICFAPTMGDDSQDLNEPIPQNPNGHDHWCSCSDCIKPKWKGTKP